MSNDYQGPGGCRTRRRMERCGRPSKSDADAQRNEVLPKREIVLRLAYEAAHGPNDDGTERFFRKAVGDTDYSSGLDPITEDSPPCVLRFYGLTSTELGHIEANHCETVADVRSAVDHAEVLQWRGCSHGVLRRLRTVLDDFDEVRSGAAGATPAVRRGPAEIRGSC
jgi:hypothetical protein